MLNEILKSTLEFLKLAPRYLIALGAISGVLLFSSEVFQKQIGFYEFTNEYRKWLGFTLVATVCIFFVSLAFDGFDWLKLIYRRKQFRKNTLKRLHCLTKEEKQILRYYFARQSRSNTLRIDDGTVNGLVAEGIILRAASVGNMLEGFAFNISDYAWDYIIENPELLDGTTNTYRTDKRGQWP